STINILYGEFLPSMRADVQRSLLCLRVNKDTLQTLFMPRIVYIKIYNSIFGTYFIVFKACEGILGLSILVSIIRSYGNDFYLILTEYY
ncbi:hypothetical protein L9F63_014858, partial [Diploptera punctata]